MRWDELIVWYLILLAHWHLHTVIMFTFLAVESHWILADWSPRTLLSFCSKKSAWLLTNPLRQFHKIQWCGMFDAGTVDATQTSDHITIQGSSSSLLITCLRPTANSENCSWRRTNRLDCGRGPIKLACPSNLGALSVHKMHFWEQYSEFNQVSPSHSRQVEFNKIALAFVLGQYIFVFLKCYPNTNTQ